MRGFPESFATKQDYLNCLQFYPEQTKKALRGLLTNRFNWEKKKELKSESDGVNDVKHRVLSEDGKFYQFEEVEDKNAQLFRLGFTVKEIEKILA